MVHAYYSGTVEKSLPSEQFGHGADVGVRGRGATPGEAFAGAALALEALFARDPASVRSERAETLACRAADLEELLVDFLDELIFLFATRRLVFSGFDVTIEESAPGEVSLRAKAVGERWDPSRHEATVEPKGATYTALRVVREAGGWVAQCVVDV
jgi:SHS2 domain-containing protein